MSNLPGTGKSEPESSRPSFTGYWKRSKDKQATQNLTFVTSKLGQSSSSSKATTSKNASKSSKNADNDDDGGQQQSSESKARERRQQVRRAQRQHRQRKANYTKQLELDVTRLRDDIARVEGEVETLRGFNGVMRAQLTSGSSSSGGQQGAATATAFQSGSLVDVGMTGVDVPTTTMMTQADEGFVLPFGNTYTVSLGILESGYLAGDGGGGAGLPMYHVRRAGPPQPSLHGVSTTIEGGTAASASADTGTIFLNYDDDDDEALEAMLSPEQTDEAINFILALERCCWDHIDQSCFQHLDAQFHSHHHHHHHHDGGNSGSGPTPEQQQQTAKEQQLLSMPGCQMMLEAKTAVAAAAAASEAANIAKGKKKIHIEGSSNHDDDDGDYDRNEEAEEEYNEDDEEDEDLEMSKEVDADGDIINGHTLMATTLALQGAPPDVFKRINEIQRMLKQKGDDSNVHGEGLQQQSLSQPTTITSTVEWPSKAISLTNLRRLARLINPLHLTMAAKRPLPGIEDHEHEQGQEPEQEEGEEGEERGEEELAPVQAWFELASLYGLAIATDRAVLARLAMLLQGQVHCVVFGAAVSRTVFEAALVTAVGFEPIAWGIGRE